MVLVARGRTRTFGLCSIYFLCNVITVKSFGGDEKKDLVFVSDGKVFQKHYRFEDFFWTGSESNFEREKSFLNGSESGVDLDLRSVEPSPSESWRTTTVFHTTTILFATVYPNINDCKDTDRGCTPQVSPVQTKSVQFSLPIYTPEVPEILPCPTEKDPQTLAYPDIFYDGEDAGGYPTSLGTPRIPTTRKTKSGSNEPTLPETDMDIQNVTGTTVFPTFPLDQKYWIMTILRKDNFSRNLDLNVTETKLSTLYKKAFKRREEKYFGGSDFQDRKDRRLFQPIKVNILNVTEVGNSMEILYYVSVAGKPIPAMTAANDMRLMTASEVIAELGYPILSKAEAYMKNVVPLGARVKGRTRDTWLFIGSVIAAVLLLVILAALFALGLSKKQTKESRRQDSGKKHVFEEGEGSRNLAFEGDDDVNAKETSKSAKSSDFKSLPQFPGTSVKFTTDERRGSTTSSSCSGSSSEASLVRLRHQQKRKEKQMLAREEKPKPKPRTRIRKIENSSFSKKHSRIALERTDSAISQNNEVTTEGCDDPRCSPCITRSPTSYLSMPSVRAFPRGTQITEPLSKILEPISIRHFDADSDSQNENSHYAQFRHKVDVEQICEVKNKRLKRKFVTRHASLEGDDPGFIGPVVWKTHCRKIGEKEADDINMDEVEENISIGRMRRRFNELLDDALSMFGSRNPSPEGIEGGSIKQPDNRVHSAVVRPAGLLSENISGSRPKTTGARRPQSAVVSGPRGAWETPSCSTLVRSETATVFQKLSSSPIVDKHLITVNSELAPSDPAVPLIAAIKHELKKFEDPVSNGS